MTTTTHNELTANQRSGKGTTASTVHVVSFAPADDQGGVGGFYWWPDLARAEQYYSQAVRESARDVREGQPGHIVRLVAFDPGQGPSADEITEIIGDDLGLVEVSLPALRQYVPPTTIPRYVPTGPTHQGFVRRGM